MKAFSGQHTFYDRTAVIDVSPFLHKEQKIQIRQWACSDQAILSDIMTIEASSSPLTPIPVAPMYDDDKTVEILHTIAGAKVDLLVNRNKGQGP